jgi:excisionase family DNA binding protein
MLTVAEACDRLRISERTLKDLIRSGDIRAIKAGTSVNSPYRISEEALADFIKRQTVVPS